MPDLEEIFTAFAKFGNVNADGKTITLTNSDKWFKQAKLFDKNITTTDSAILFGKLKSKNVTYEQFLTYLEDLAKTKNVSIDEIKRKLVDCSAPGTSNVTKVAKMGVTDRLTDTAGYTGAHKERFDESGKGKGKEGREDTADTSGYVSGYKGKNTYDKTH